MKTPSIAKVWTHVFRNRASNNMMIEMKLSNNHTYVVPDNICHKNVSTNSLQWTLDTFGNNNQHTFLLLFTPGDSSVKQIQKMLKHSAWSPNVYIGLVITTQSDIEYFKNDLGKLSCPNLCIITTPTEQNMSFTKLLDWNKFSGVICGSFNWKLDVKVKYNIVKRLARQCNSKYDIEFYFTGWGRMLPKEQISKNVMPRIKYLHRENEVPTHLDMDDSLYNFMLARDPDLCSLLHGKLHQELPWFVDRTRMTV